MATDRAAAPEADAYVSPATGFLVVATLTVAVAPACAAVITL